MPCGHSDGARASWAQLQSMQLSHSPGTFPGPAAFQGCPPSPSRPSPGRGPTSRTEGGGLPLQPQPPRGPSTPPLLGSASFVFLVMRSQEGTQLLPSEQLRVSERLLH